MSRQSEQPGDEGQPRDPRERFTSTEWMEIIQNPPGPPEPWEIEYDRQLEEEIRQDIANTKPLYPDDPRPRPTLPLREPPDAED